jgi:hypothetical protein
MLNHQISLVIMLVFKHQNANNSNFMGQQLVITHQALTVQISLVKKLVGNATCGINQISWSSSW